MEKIGIAIVTRNRRNYLEACINSIINLLKYDHIIIVNDGDTPFTFENIPTINNKENLGVGKSKNKGIKYLLDNGCDHIFVIEDDIVIKDNNVLDQYIKTSKASNILHLNYALGTPFNRKQKTIFDLHNRNDLELESEPNPKLNIDYGNDISISLYQHISGMFSYYHKSVFENIGLIDEQYFNAWEHVDHSYQAIMAGYHPPFWWFVDIANSDQYLEPQKDSIKNSSTSKNTEKWMKNVQVNAEKYKVKNGHYPAQTPLESQENVIQWLKNKKKEK